MTSGQFRLFEPGVDPADTAREPGPAAISPEAAQAAAELPPAIRLGTSSWSFTGWTGLIYDRPATETELARRGLPAYAAHPLLKTVGVDRTYYAPVPEQTFADWASAVPDDFRFLVKAHNLLLSPTLPTRGERPRAGAAEPNPRFLDAAYAAEAVIGPCVRGLGRKAGPILFQFSPLPLVRATARRPLRPGEIDPGEFLDRLAAFLAALPTGPLYAVEIRNPVLLTDRYRDALAAARSRRYPQGVAHCYAVHPTMPPVSRQASVIDPHAQPAIVARWVLHPAQTYEGARARYRPFDRLVDEDVQSRDAFADLCLRAAESGREAWLTVNNKAEGSAPLTLIRLALRIGQRRREPA